MLTAPSLAELVSFTGRPAGTFGSFAAQALAQAALMFSVVTKLGDYPDDADLAQLARNAILEMADRLLLEQPYTAIKAGPFQTETIGSYSYSRVTTTAGRAQQGLKTGLFWWDIAVDELTVAGTSLTAHGSIGVQVDGIEMGPDNQLRVSNSAGQPPDWPPYVRIS